MTDQLKETKEALKFLLSFGNAVGASLADGRIGWADAFNFIGTLKTVQPAFAGASNIPAEIAAITEAQKEELKQFIKDEFDIPQDSLEPLIEKGLSVAVELTEIVKFFTKG